MQLSEPEDATSTTTTTEAEEESSPATTTNVKEESLFTKRKQAIDFLSSLSRAPSCVCVFHHDKNRLIFITFEKKKSSRKSSRKEK